jgi:hypothetical protein
MNRTPYSNNLEINHKTLTKMKFVLNKEGVWVTTDQVGARAEEEHDEEEKPHVGGDDEFADMFETPPTTSSSKNASTSS